jgi:N-methylhydantoinase A
MSYRIGIDVGGTFTDCVLLRPDGSVALEKAPTTPGDQSVGVVTGLSQLAAVEGVTLEELVAQTRTIVHGTTTGDNTMIQMCGAPTGLLVTRGFRDEIEFRRCYKEEIWDPSFPAPEPIARRRVRLEVDERMTAEGEVETPLDEDGVRRAVARLRAFGVTSIAVSLLYSYLNPAHELRVGEIVHEEYPEVEMVSLSHQVLPKPPEFERTSTTLVNAYIGPPIARYLSRLSEELTAVGYRHDLLVATSAGGVATADAASKRAVATIGSGPTGGVTAAAGAAARAGLGDVVSVDMGGTSYDLCLIRGGRPEIKMDWNWRHRYCIGIPMVDIAAIGAGGGSVIWVDDGVLEVGPHSAGSDPGPVCYGRGGIEPTVTDADLVLGRLEPAGFANGRMELDLEAARAALAELGEPLGMDAEEVAVAAVRLVDAHMTEAVRRELSLAGADPRVLDLVAFGGMGAVHATTQAAALGMSRVLVPRAAAGLSAVGLLTADHVIDDSRGYVVPWQQADPVVLQRLADELASAATEELRVAGVPDDRVSLHWSLLMVYPGQTFDVSIPVDAPTDLEAAVTEFHRRNEEARLIEARAQEPVLRGIRLTTVGGVDKMAPLSLAPADGAPVAAGTRRMWLAGGWTEGPVFDAEALRPGAEVVGPAVVISPFTSLVLRPGDRCTMTDDGDLLVEVQPEA